MELHAAERNDIAAALSDLLSGGVSVPIVQSAPGLGMGLSLGSTFVLPFALGVVELERPASLAPALVEPAPSRSKTAGGSSAGSGVSPASKSKKLRIRMLGRFEVEVDGVVVESWRSKRARQLCAYLALNRREDLSRHRLMGVFWPEHPEERAENNLSLTVMALRRLLDGERTGSQTLVPFRASAYALEAGALWLDTDAFEEAASAGSRFEAASDFEGAAASLDEAIELYAGDLLPADVYEDWTVDLRQHLQDLHTDVLQRRAGLARRTNDYDTSIDLNRRLLTRDPAFEPAHRQLMLDYLATGQRSRAVAQMSLCREALQRHLGVEPEPATRAVFAKVTG
jgi:DNA-binding SARP family transcriptional activator